MNQVPRYHKTEAGTLVRRALPRKQTRNMQTWQTVKGLLIGASIAVAVLALAGALTLSLE